VTSCLEERVELLKVLGVGDDNGHLCHPLQGRTHFLKIRRMQYGLIFRDRV
jgi:hypothetical protein